VIKEHILAIKEIRLSNSVISDYNCVANYVLGKNLEKKIILKLFFRLIKLEDHPGETKEELITQLLRLNSVEDKEFDGRRGDFRFKRK